MNTIDLLDTTKYAPVRKPKGRVRRLAERGMTTAEYAVGILAACALALVLLKVFSDNQFFTALLKLVIKLIGTVGGMIK
ncbi:DUF4244 domain-containing protein [Aestuariimicrobium ganziense]|uniref:DUF4244 domain-containing protein n=1 Tax=Aestuariimicrobium ganziense TaxID=2773677 RepID=UPI0019433A0B|nr:DUF4244 domain-containing protein [Aestuariimicrobium ganziense]